MLLDYRKPQRLQPGRRKPILLGLCGLLVLGFIYLASGNPPAPQAPGEIAIPKERLFP